MSDAEADARTAEKQTAEEAVVLPSQLLAARLTECIQTVLKPDGKSYTDEEIAEGVRARTVSAARPKGIGTRSYIWELRKGKSRTAGKGPPKPSPEVLAALADFFGQSPGYFLATSRDHADAMAAQLEVFQALQRLGPLQIAARSFTLDGWARDPAAPPEEAAPPPTDAATLRRFAATLNRVADQLDTGQPHDAGAPQSQPPFSST